MRHHVSLYSQVSTNERSAVLPVTTPSLVTESTPTPGAGPMSHSPLNPIACPSQVPTSTLCVGTSKSVLLHTAQVTLYNPERPSSTVKVGAVLDTGSQMSYATDVVKKAVNSELEETQQISIITFGTTTQDPRRYRVIRVGLKLKDVGDTQLRLITVPSICEPLTAQPIALCLRSFNTSYTD